MTRLGRPGDRRRLQLQSGASVFVVVLAILIVAANGRPDVEPRATLSILAPIPHTPQFFSCCRDMGAVLGGAICCALRRCAAPWCSGCRAGPFSLERTPAKTTPARILEAQRSATGPSGPPSPGVRDQSSAERCSRVTGVSTPLVVGAVRRTCGSPPSKNECGTAPHRPEQEEMHQVAVAWGLLTDERAPGVGVQGIPAPRVRSAANSRNSRSRCPRQNGEYICAASIETCVQQKYGSGSRSLDWTDSLDRIIGKCCTSSAAPGVSSDTAPWSLPFANQQSGRPQWQQPCSPRS